MSALADADEIADAGRALLDLRDQLSGRDRRRCDLAVQTVITILIMEAIKLATAQAERAA